MERVLDVVRCINGASLRIIHGSDGRWRAAAELGYQGDYVLTTVCDTPEQAIDALAKQLEAWKKSRLEKWTVPGQLRLYNLPRVEP